MTWHTDWAPEDDLTAWIRDFRDEIGRAYSARPLLVKEHGRQEDSFRTGGYAARQVLELVQNAADALGRGGTRGRVEVHLTGDTLYCANKGAPLSKAGLEAITAAYLSTKQGDEMGRFGLGFKSVLGVSDRPAVFSRSVSVGFDRELAREELGEIAPDAGAYPVLRWPIILDFATEAAEDPVLADLGEWAQTIVRLPVQSERDRLAADVVDFPGEFLLFADNVQELRLRLSGQADPVDRRLTCEIDDGDRRTVRDGESASTWRVWHRRHRPSPEALAEVGEAIRREEVRLSYAAPLDDTHLLGRFWAYFPLQDQTSARGIHNAPWRINDDRTSMLPGVFNAELLDQLAQMIVEALPTLTREDDPARHFDYMPARGREAQSDADRRLAELVPHYARTAAVVPDAEGWLRPADELRYPHFDLRLPPETMRLWEAHTPERSVWPHSSCFANNIRKARLRSLVRLDERPSPHERPAAVWLEALTPDALDDQARAALEVLFSITDDLTRRDFLDARVLPDRDGRLHQLRETRQLFISGTLLSATPGLTVMRPSFVNDDKTVARLRDLGFVEVDPAVELQRLAGSVSRKWRGPEWNAFWDLTLEVPTQQASDIISKLAAEGVDVKIRTASKGWASVDEAVIPALVEPRSRDLTVDLDYHDLHRSLLALLGVDVRPAKSAAMAEDRTYLEYLRLNRESYPHPPGAKRIPSEVLRFRDTEVLGPLYVLRRFGDTNDVEAQVAWTRELLAADAPDQVDFGPLHNRSLPSARVAAPHLWAARRYGLVASTWGPRSADQVLAPSCLEHADTLPVCTDPLGARIVDLADPGKLPAAVWAEYLSRDPGPASPAALGRAALTAIRNLPASETPGTVPAALGAATALVEASSVHVAVSEDECRALTEQDLPLVSVEDTAAAVELCDRLGCRLAYTVLRVEYALENATEPVALLDRYRGLRAVSAGRLDGWELISCSNLSRVVTTADGVRTIPETVAFSEKAVLFLDEVPEDELLAAVSERFDLGLGPVDVERVLDAALDQEIQERVARCRAADGFEDKLLALLPVAVLEMALPEGLLRTVRAESGDMGAEQVARLLYHVHGYNTLIELRHHLADAGFDTPDRWAGSPTAVAFVRSLGMPVEYAGSSSTRLATSLTVLGPPRLNPLHPYQEELRDQVRALLRSDPPERALLFLPTGAGKTRVTVQAVAESIAAGEVTGPILWIAQTSELCEQAVQTWQTVWREMGTHPLAVHRLWATNEVAPSDDLVSVIVATDAKLASIRVRDDYDWLRQTHAVILDEAHGATEAGVGQILAWLGLDGRRTERPLLGLTATPFKGRGQEANDRLARRFGHRKLDVLGEDSYGALQEMGVLARVQHERLDGGEFDLEAGERSSFETFKDLPRSVLDRVGRDTGRTQRLVKHISGLDPEWPVLVFTPSVLSAQIVAALLRLRGITAGTVSGSTPAAERRRTIEDFRSGRIRVLTNCSVLTEGFDAPEVRALYIARPTFSPNAYIQMVGRGLRGPANGGKPECLVVNVDDTFAQFGDQLAYREFDYLWDREGGAPQ